MSEKFEDAENYPVESSASGENAYYLNNCEVVGHRPAYCVCLRKIEERKNGALATVYSDCSAAIGKKQCPAQRMRKEELAEGRAIYFINRRKVNAFRQYEEEMERQRLSVTPPAKDKPRTERVSKPSQPEPTQHFLDVATGDYADAINRSLATQEKAEKLEKTKKSESAKPAPQKPAEQPKTAPAAQLKPGMSLLELARLQLQAQAT